MPCVLGFSMPGLAWLERPVPAAFGKNCPVSVMRVDL